MTHKQSIVIVDDTPENLHLLGEMLGEHGYRVRSAPNGERALATVQKEPPDLILLDILMPGLNGYDVCRQLKADPRSKDIPVIFISALNEVFDKVTAFSIGGVDYITKPFQIEEVLARIQTHLSLEALRQQLREQNAELQARNSELDSFARTVAHDLKNPLMVLLGTLDLLREMQPDVDDEMKHILEMSLRGARKLASIVDELLLLSSIRRESVHLTPIDMGQCVRQSLERLTPLVKQSGAEIVLPEAWPQVNGYAPWIEEVWANYLSNAMKYGGTPPRLELASTLQADGMLRFSVRDNGAGLDSDAQAQLFTEFTRLDQVRAEGHGLGLSIVRRIMDKLGGQYGVESTPGGGSTFYFSLWPV